MTPCFFVTFVGSYEDPNNEGGVSGPYPTRKEAMDWVDLLKFVNRQGIQTNPKRAVCLIRVLPYR